MRYVLLVVGFFTATAALAQSKGDQSILATYGEEHITLQDLAESEPALVSWIGLGTGAEEVVHTVDGMIMQRLLAQEAQESGIASDREVKEQIDRILSKAYLKKFAPNSSVEITPEEVKARYEKNRDKYKSQELLKVSHILVATRDEANKIKKDLAGGEKWSTLASQFSLDQASAKRSGVIGLVPPNQLLPEIRKQVSSLSVGEVGGPVKTSLGYHLVKLEERPSVVYRPLEDVKKDLYTELLREKNNENLKEIRQQLWKKYNVSVDRGTIDSLVEEKTQENATVERASLGKQRRQPGEPTELQLVSESFDLGPISSQKVTEKVLLSNSSSKDISIYRVGSTCKCVEVSVEPKILEPGAVGTLTFTYDPLMFHDKNRVERVLFIESTDSLEPRKFIRFSAQLPG